jgi:hypothetical protein
LKGADEVGAAKDPEHRDRLSRLEAEQRRAERRNGAMLVGGAVLLAGAMVGAVTLAGGGDDQQQAAESATPRIEGVVEFGGLSKNHVQTAVDYPQAPPVGGDHAPVWANCGVYTAAVSEPQGTHSLEHGAVWIGYRRGLPDDQLQELQELAEANSYVLLSPVAKAPSAVTASAWGRQLGVESAGDPRLQAFVQAYQQSPDAPEPGAPCTGGAAGM